MSAPNPGRCSIVVSVSRVLFSSSGGALVARFGEIWSLETEDACRVCPPAPVCCGCCVLLSFEIAVLSARANERPQSWSISIVVSVSRMRFSSSGGVLGNVDFDELRAGLSSLYVTALLFADSAAYSVRCFVIARALCLLL